MIEQIQDIIEKTSVLINIVGILVILGGVTIAVVRFMVRYPTSDHDLIYKNFKVGLGNSLLLGLEILVLADIIKSITITPTYKSLAGLMFIIVLRTIVSWTLTLEVEGHWPWQKESNHV